MPDKGAIRIPGAGLFGGGLAMTHLQENGTSAWDCPATALAAAILRDRIAVEEGYEMPCPATGGLLCGADDCLTNGCIEEREA